MNYERLFALALIFTVSGCSEGVSGNQFSASRNAAVPNSAVHSKRFNLPRGSATPIIYIEGVNGNRVQSYTYGGALLTELTKAHVKGSDIAIDPTTANLYVMAYSGSHSVAYVWPYGAKGTAAPIASLDYSAHTSTSFTRMAIDSSGYLWEGGGYPSQGMLRFAPGAIGNSRPIQYIVGPRTQVYFVLGLATDSSGNLYVLNSGSDNQILKFNSTARGDVAPVKVIAGSKTGLNDALVNAIAVDSNGRMIVASNNSKILIWNASDRGNVTPDVTISGSNTQLYHPQGVATGGSNDIYVTNPHNNTILVFASTATNNAAPIRVISTKIPGRSVALCRNTDRCQSNI